MSSRRSGRGRAQSVRVAATARTPSGWQLTVGAELPESVVRALGKGAAAELRQLAPVVARLLPLLPSKR